MTNRADSIVARMGAALSVFFVAFSASAATPLPTQYIAPVATPDWEHAILKTDYGQNQGFTFERTVPYSVNGRSGYNYSLSIDEKPYYAYDRVIKQDHYGHDPVARIVRSVTAKAGGKAAPARRYLYNTPKATNEVFDPAYTDVGDATYVENLAINNGFDSARHDPYAAYVQGVHTDWVYTVTFDGNGGSGTMQSQTITNSAPLATNIFTKAGHTFDGWATSPGGARAYDDGATVSGDLTLYARWKARGYAVAFFAGTGVAEMFYRIGESGSWVRYDEVFMADSGSRVFGYAVAASGYTEVNTCTSPWSDVVTVANLSATLSATANVYTITFNPVGGSVTPTTTGATYKEKYPDLPTPTHTNTYATAGYITSHAFAGWYTTQSGGEQRSSSDTYATVGNQTLYAHWTTANTPKRYVLAFDGNGATAGSMQPVPVSYGDTVTLEACGFSRRGYDFSGWSRATDETARYTDGAKINVNDDYIKFSSYTNNATVLLYAKWAARQCAVSFDGNGGSSPSSKNVTFGGKYGSLANSSWTGHAFAGWWTAREGGSQVTAETQVTDPNDHTLYAHWTANSYTVTFNANGGGDPSFETTNVTYGAAYGELPTCTRTGYTFAGWYTLSTGGTKITPTTTVSLTSAQTLYAHWTANSYTVTFDAVGGTPSPASKIVTFDSTYGTLETPKLAGYTFAGWYTAMSGGTKVESSTKVTVPDNHTLYAHWTGQTYTVTVSPSGGSGGSCPSYVTSTGSQTKTLTPPTRKGYSISSWTVSGASGGTPTVSGNTLTIPGGTHGNLTLTPTWTANSYTVTFNANGGGTPTPAAMNVTYDLTYGKLATCERDGYQFDGWWTDPEAGEKIEETDKVAITSSQTLYAHWATYTLTLYGNGGLVGGLFETNTLPCVLNAPYPELPEAVRAGYQFAGWWTDAAYTNGVQKTTNDLVTVEAPTLYARWKTPSTAATCTVTLNPGEEGAVEEPELTRTVGAALGDLPAPTPNDSEEHLFFGWYDAGGNAVSRDAVVTSDLTLTAKWSEKKFNDALGNYDVCFTTSAEHPWTVDEDGVHSATIVATGSKSDLCIEVPRSGRTRLECSWQMVKKSSSAYFGWVADDDVVEKRKGGEGSKQSETQTVKTDEFLLLRQEVTYMGDTNDRAWLDSLTWTPDPVETPIDTWDSAVALSQAPTNAVFETGGSAEWEVTENAAEFAEGVNGIVSVTNLPHGRSTWARMTVSGPGYLSFKWKVSSERGYVGTDGRYAKCDYLEFCDGERTVGFIDGETDFATFVHAVETEGSHTFTWRYVKDGTDAAGLDRGFVDAVTWTPSAPEGDGTYTIRFSVPDDFDKPGDMTCGTGKVYRLPDLPPGYKWRRLDAQGRLYDGGILVFNLTEKALLQMEAVQVP